MRNDFFPFAGVTCLFELDDLVVAAVLQWRARHLWSNPFR